MNDKLKVELFRDTASPDASVLDLAEGVNMLNKYMNDRLEIVGATRLLRITDTDNGTITNKNVMHLDTGADIPIIATEREIDPFEDGRMIGGTAFYWEMGSIAVVNVLLPDNPAQTTFHEVGHLFGLAPTESFHCADEACGMYEEASYKSARKISERHAIGHNGFYDLFDKRKNLAYKSSPAHGLCDTCEEHLAGNPPLETVLS